MHHITPRQKTNKKRVTLTIGVFRLLFKHKGLELQDEIEYANEPHLVQQNGGLDVGGTQEDIDLDLQRSGGCPSTTTTRGTARAENFSKDVGTSLAVVV